MIKIKKPQLNIYSQMWHVTYEGSKPRVERDLMGFLKPEGFMNNYIYDDKEGFYLIPWHRIFSVSRENE